MPKLRAFDVPTVVGSKYPAPFDVPCRERISRRLGDATGMKAFGVTMTRLPPGAWSAQRHWHSHEDEFVYMLEGTATLVTDEGEELLVPGDCVGFKAGDKNGHCIQNHGAVDVLFLVVGSRSDEDHGEYPDIDMKFTAGRYTGKSRFTHKNGEPYT
ncbi:MAG: cupin domain-containing protein [Polyangiaceae bacterium]